MPISPSAATPSKASQVACIGKQLLRNAVTWAKNQGATRAQLLVDVENTDAVGYYQHLNWESTQLQAHRVFL